MVIVYGVLCWLRAEKSVCSCPFSLLTILLELMRYHVWLILSASGQIMSQVDVNVACQNKGEYRKHQLQQQRHLT
jgi:hypothetical protein